MISKIDLYDLTASFVSIRINIKYELNSIILHEIVKVLCFYDKTYEDNQIRKAIASINNLDKERWYFVYHNNIYVRHQLLKEEAIYQLLIKVCNLLIQLLEDEEYENAYDLVDTIHFLPDIIADNNFTIKQSYWNTLVKDYRDKWDKNFLLKEQKELNK